MVCHCIFLAADKKPKLRDAFRDLLPLAHEWSTIGILLGVPKHILERIKVDESGARNRLQEMLSEWLKQVDPEPTWASLVEAVENVDQRKAREMRTRFWSWVFWLCCCPSVTSYIKFCVSLLKSTECKGRKIKPSTQLVAFNQSLYAIPLQRSLPWYTQDAGTIACSHIVCMNFSACTSQLHELPTPENVDNLLKLMCTHQ